MKQKVRSSLVCLAVIGGACLLPSLAEAQACMGLPLEARSLAALGEVAFQSRATQYAARMGRDLGGEISAFAHVVYASFERDPWTLGGTGDGQAIGGTAVYRTFLDEFPVCSFLGLRYGWSSANATMPGLEPDVPAFTLTHRTSGTTAFVGLGTGVGVPLSPATELIPFGNLRVGWTQLQRRYRCAPASACGPGQEPTEGLGHVEAEIGLLLRYRRFLVGGGARAMFLESDPVLQLARATEDQALLLTVSFGLAF